MQKKFEFEAPKSLTEIVANRVRQAIIDGEFHLGEMISEDALAKSFGVSRTPVRDALSMLQNQGLVEIRSKRGSFVFQPSEADVQSICDFRVLLEVHAAKLSAAKGRDALIAALQATLQAMDAADAEHDGIAYGRNDSLFHEALFVDCGNACLRDAYALVSGKIAAMRTVFSRQFTDARAVSLREHHAAFRLIDEARFTELETLLQVHIGRTVEAYRLAMQAKPPRNAAVS